MVTVLQIFTSILHAQLLLTTVYFVSLSQIQMISDNTSNQLTGILKKHTMWKSCDNEPNLLKLVWYENNWCCQVQKFIIYRKHLVGNNYGLIYHVKKLSGSSFQSMFGGQRGPITATGQLHDDMDTYALTIIHS